MNRHRLDDSSNEVSYEQELKTLLSVAPSPTFEARVRMQVAHDSVQGRWTLQRALGLAGASVAILVFALVWFSRHYGASRPAISVSMPARPASRAEAPPASLIAQNPPAPTSATTGLDRPTDARASTRVSLAVIAKSEPGEPEILIDPAEGRAMRRFLAALREGTIVIPLLPVEPVRASATPEPLRPIEPLTQIEPLSAVSQQEGLRQ